MGSGHQENPAGAGAPKTRRMFLFVCRPNESYDSHHLSSINLGYEYGAALPTAICSFRFCSRLCALVNWLGQLTWSSVPCLLPSWAAEAWLTSVDSVPGLQVPVRPALVAAEEKRGAGVLQVDGELQPLVPRWPALELWLPHRERVLATRVRQVHRNLF